MKRYGWYECVGETAYFFEGDFSMSIVIGKLSNHIEVLRQQGIDAEEKIWAAT